MKTFLTRLFRYPKVEPEQAAVPVTADEPARPNPEDFKGRPIGDFLKALGSTEDTSAYAREKGVTTLYFRLGDLRPKPRDGSDEAGPDA